MIKKILFIQIISLMLCSCSSFPLEEKPVTHMSDDLTTNEKMLVKQQIDDKRRDFIDDLENIKVTISLELEIDGTITKAEIKSITCPPGAEEMCRLVAETTKKAAKKASPIKNLRPDRHDIWKTIELVFDLSSWVSESLTKELAGDKKIN